MNDHIHVVCMKEKRREIHITKFGQKILGDHPILTLGISKPPVKRIWLLCRPTLCKSVPYSTVSGYCIKPLIFH